ncbi:MAG: hypothetical protein JO027_05710 [Solirubrobacterales bacterium]|nr:hypothetical protein [Solirubrobacterales bacterium]
MGMYRGLSRRARIALVTMVVALATAGSAAAFQALPPGVQVNDDVAAGINPALSVSGEDPTNADLVGGALVAGKPAVPWSIFRQQESPGADQIFSRSFANGAWTTRGNGTVGGRSSASPTFTGSLNFDQGQDGEAPSIDFAGPGRTVPWASWYENTTGTNFGNNNVFASRFDNTGDANQGKWIFAGQSRGNGGSGPDVPSLNIHTDQDAENPSVAGGSAVDPTKPGPWVTWQETTTSPVNGKDQIFVSKPLGPGMTTCDNVTPLGVADASGHIPSIGGFCFQDVGVQRVGPGGADPSLNVDVTRNGIEPDIAFTGANDSVPWVVWYEKDSSAAGLANNELVFAAKGEADNSVGVDGGFHWHVIGNTGNGILNAANSCAGSLPAEQACSLNSDPTKDAEDPQVAAGTMNPANPTAPWVTWDETDGGVHQVFVSRFVATPTPHFQIVNGGNPISTPGVESTRPDLTFSGNTPYVTWREQTPAGTTAFVGHFVNAANPTFVLDESDVPLTPTAQADVREPISSACIATPFNLDGQACQGGAVGTPFFLFTNGTSPRGLFADAYQPGLPVTGGASGVSSSAATVSGTVDPQGAAVKVSFQFGTTTAYGQSTPAQTLAPARGPVAFTAALTGLPAGTTIHYRAVASSDFGTFAGADQVLSTGTPTPVPGSVSLGHGRASGKAVVISIACTGGSCQLRLTLTAQGRHHRRVRVGSTSVTLNGGQAGIVRIALNGAGRNLLAARRVLRVRLTAVQSSDGGQLQTIGSRTIIIKIHRH